MAQLTITFRNNTLNGSKVVAAISVRGKKMSKKWISQMYGPDCTDTYYYVNNIQYGCMWVVGHYSERFCATHWDLSIIAKGQEDLPNIWSYTNIDVR